jgi:hypothetical protein
VAGRPGLDQEDDVAGLHYSRALLSACVLAVPVLLVAQSGIAAPTRAAPRAPSGSSRRAASHQGTTACQSPGLLFCENFEGLPAGAATSPKWTIDTQQGTLTIEKLRRNSSNQVLHAHTVGNGRALLTINNFKAPGNTFFGRMWVTIKALPTAPDFAHFILVQATGTGSAEMVRPVGGQFINTQFLKNGGTGRSLWGVGADGGATGDWTNWKESATAVAGAWQCIQWSIQAAGNTAQMRVNGATNPGLVVSTKQHGGKPVPFVLPVVRKIQIGWWLFQPSPAPIKFDLRYDNIALSSHPLGCGPAPR